MALKGYATKTIKHQLSIFKILFKYARMKRFISSDETQYVLLPEGQKAVKRRALTKEEVKKRTEKFGKNKLQEKKKKSWAAKFFEQFKDVMIVILIIAAVVSFVIL